MLKTKLSKILKEGDPSNLITKELEYLANKQINTEDGNVFIYESIIHNGSNKNGIGDFNSSENGIKVRFGTSGAISGHRADYVVEAIFVIKSSIIPKISLFIMGCKAGF